MQETERDRDYHRAIAYKVVERAFGKMTPADKGAIMRVIARELRAVVTSATADVRDFHERFGLTYDGPPRQLNPETSDFRAKFMQEELDEYRAAVYAGDLGQQFDALIDLVYVALGTAYLQGFPFADGWNEVQRANMRKVRADDARASKRGSALDVVKPYNWVPPDVHGVLERRFAKFEALAGGWKGSVDEH